MRQWIQDWIGVRTAQAGLVEGGLETAAEIAQLGEQQDLPSFIGNVLQYVIAFVGVILLVIVVYGGFLWMTAGGDEEKVKKARGLIINGVIGLIIVLLSYAILAAIEFELFDILTS